MSATGHGAASQDRRRLKLAAAAAWFSYSAAPPLVGAPGALPRRANHAPRPPGHGGQHHAPRWTAVDAAAGGAGACTRGGGVQVRVNVCTAGVTERRRRAL